MEYFVLALMIGLTALVMWLPRPKVQRLATFRCEHCGALYDVDLGEVTPHESFTVTHGCASP